MNTHVDGFSFYVNGYLAVRSGYLGSPLVVVQQPSLPDKTQDLSGPLDCCGALSGCQGVVPVRVILQMEQTVCAN